MSEEWLTLKDAAARLGVSHTTVGKLVARGDLPFVETPHGRIFSAGAVAALRAKRAAEDAEPEPAVVAGAGVD